MNNKINNRKSLIFNIFFLILSLRDTENARHNPHDYNTH